MTELYFMYDDCPDCMYSKESFYLGEKGYDCKMYDKLIDSLDAWTRCRFYRKKY
jgi:hypothetical protein